jgi:chemotaxis methyl-accepting protein methylase
MYKYKVLLFRLTNRPIIYQKYINNILCDYLNDFYTIYLDNILIYLDDPLKHKIYIRLILQKLYDISL